MKKSLLVYRLTFSLCLLGALYSYQSAFAVGAINLDLIPSPLFSQLAGASVENAASFSILEELFRTTLEALLENPRSPRYLTLSTRIREIQESYIQTHEANQHEILKDEAGFPILFLSVKDVARENTRELRKQQKKELIAASLPEVDVDRLAETEVETLYTRLTLERGILDKANHGIAGLIESSGRNSGYMGNEIQIQRRDLDSFLISVNGNPFFAYSVFELLHFSREFKKFRLNLPVDDREPIYSGELEFPLTLPEIQDLSSWINEVQKWQTDFSQILAALVGESAVELGQKSKEELLKGAQCTPQARTLLEGFPADRPALLFNTVSINLENHPDRNALRNLLEREFDQAALVARHGDRKRFLTGTYRANIGIPQLRALAPALNKIIMAKKLTEEIYGPRAFFDALIPNYNHNEVESGLDILKQFKMTELGSVLKTVLNRPFNQEFYQIQNGLFSQPSIEATERKSLELFEEILRTHSGVNFYRDPNANPERPVISPDQIRALYTVHDAAGAQIKPQISYRGGISHKNVPALITSLRQSASFLNMLNRYPGLDRELVGFQNQIVEKLNTYSALPREGYFSRQLFDEALNYLETLVSKIVYQDHSGVTQNSVENALHQLAGIAGEELVRGCSMGFTGRMSQILSGLVVSVGDGLRDHLENEKQTAFQLVSQAVAIQSGASSDVAARVNPLMASTLGLSGIPITGTVSQALFTQNNYAQLALGVFVSKYNPVSVYHSARKMLGDEFWRLNDEKDDEGMYRFLISLGFGKTVEQGDAIEANRAQLDRDYRVNGNPENRWQYAFFQQNLPSRLVQLLFEKGILYSTSPNANGMTAVRAFQGGQQISMAAADSRLRPGQAGAPRLNAPAGVSSAIGFRPESVLDQVRPQSGG